MAEWDAAVAAAFESDPRLTNSTVVIGDIEFVPRLYVAPILGFAAFSLDYSGSLMPKGGCSELKAIDYPVKFIDVGLYKSEREQPMDLASRRDDARIFLAPDLPPVAIHDFDLLYVEDETSISITDLQIIGATQRLFGRSATDYLSDEVCLALIQALQTNPYEVPTTMQP